LRKNSSNCPERKNRTPENKPYPALQCFYPAFAVPPVHPFWIGDCPYRKDGNQLPADSLPEKSDQISLNYPEEADRAVIFWPAYAVQQSERRFRRILQNSGL
jgi:hypothetical protein